MAQDQKVKKHPTNFIRLDIKAIEDCKFGPCKNGNRWYARFRAFQCTGFHPDGTRRPAIFITALGFFDDPLLAIFADMSQVEEGDRVQVAGRLAVKPYRRKDGSQGLELIVLLTGDHAEIRPATPITPGLPAPASSSRKEEG